MLKLKSHRPRYTVSVDIFDLPEEARGSIRDHSVATENMYDYADGDYYTVPDFGLLAHDSTPDDVVNKHLAGDLSDDEYPVADASDGFEDLATYLNWLKALRFIAANVPAETLEKEKVAIHVWH